MFDWSNPTGVILLSARPPFMKIVGKIDRKAIINFPITTERFDVSLFLIEYGFLYC